MLSSARFKCSLHHAKRAFYRASNDIFVKVGRFASEEVVLQLLNTKCIPVLLYGLEVCELKKSDLSSLDFVVNRFFMKLLKTTDMKVICDCQDFFVLNYLVYG